MSESLLSSTSSSSSSDKTPEKMFAQADGVTDEVLLKLAPRILERSGIDVIKHTGLLLSLLIMLR